MSKDDFDIYSHLRKDTTGAALNLLNGLENRRYGYLLGYGKSKEDLEIYAEEEFIRKKDFDELRCEMPGLPRSTFLMVFSPDGSKVASTHGNHNIYVTDIKSGKNIKTLVGHPRTPWCIAFHPTSDQIIASGCLGGQVRIWDLSGGSEVWTAAHQTVIASLAFHPNDRVLVIATYNEVYFWDWSKPEPFVHAATSNPKEKVRYVAFDTLGHKLITGIANSPQTRWERVRAPVPVPRQAMCSNPYRRRITQRLANPPGTSLTSTSLAAAAAQAQAAAREWLREREGGGGGGGPGARGGTVDLVPNIPLRERRITACHRNLVREYEQLVQRYLQLYRPPTMIDRGTDPMEPNPWFNSSGTQTSNEQSEQPTPPPTQTPSGGETPATPAPAPAPGSSGSTGRTNDTSASEPGPSSSAKDQSEGVCAAAGGGGQPSPSPSVSSSSSHTLITPSRIFSTMKKRSTSFRGTQTTESRKREAGAVAEAAGAEGGAEETAEAECQQKRFKKSDNRPPKRGRTTGAAAEAGEGSTTSSEFRVRSRSEEEEGDTAAAASNTAVGVEASASAAASTSEGGADVEMTSAAGGPGGREGATAPPNAAAVNGVEELLLNIRRTAEEEVRNRILPIINSVPANDRPELIRLFEKGREHVRKRVRQMYPVFLRRPNKRHLNIIDSSESSTSDDDNSNSDNRVARCTMEGASHVSTATTTSTQGSSTSLLTDTTRAADDGGSGSGGTPTIGTGGTSTTTSITTTSVRNFNTELEQLVTSLLTEIGRDDDRSRRRSDVSSTATAGTVPQPPPFGSSPAALPSPSDTPAPPGTPLANLLFQECLQMLNARDDAAAVATTLITSTTTATTASSGSSSSSSTSMPATSSGGAATTPATNAANAASSAAQTAPAGVSNLDGTRTITSTRTATHSTVYSPSSIASAAAAAAAAAAAVPRRRFFSHRISAFMPTRVNYTR
ncbi:unnamed protein product [Callosobruchus maculatus]|nr:unnamed protein product [Callosobruchus maculatus]